MLNPDIAAATEHRAPQAGDLTEGEHIGAVITIADCFDTTITGTLEKVEHLGAFAVTLTIKPNGREFASVIRVHRDAPYTLVSPSPVPDIQPVNVELMREIASIDDKITALEGEIKDLKKRRGELDGKLVEGFAANGVQNMKVGGRTFYVRSTSGARFLERPEGGFYTYDDVIPVLRELGREELIKPETVNWQTLSSLLREYRDAKKPVPDALAKIVRLDTEPHIGVRSA